MHKPNRILPLSKHGPRSPSSVRSPFPWDRTSKSKYLWPVRSRNRYSEGFILCPLNYAAGCRNCFRGVTIYVELQSHLVSDKCPSCCLLLEIEAPLVASYSCSYREKNIKFGIGRFPRQSCSI